MRTSEWLSYAIVVAFWSFVAGAFAWRVWHWWRERRALRRLVGSMPSHEVIARALHEHGDEIRASVERGNPLWQKLRER